MKIFQQSIAQLGSVSSPVAAGSTTSTPNRLTPPQLVNLEKSLQDCVKELKNGNRIIGTPLTLEEMLNPVEEREIGYSPYHFEGGDEEIVSQVQQVTSLQNLQNSTIMEVDSDDSDNDEPLAKQKTATEVIKICEEMEKLCLRFGSIDDSLDLSKCLRRFRVQLSQETMKKARQSMLEMYWRS